MTGCIHEKVCAEYMRRYGKILSKHCPKPNRCPFFDDGNSVDTKRLADLVADAVAEEFGIKGGETMRIKRKTVPRDMVDDCYGV